MPDRLFRQNEKLASSFCFISGFAAGFSTAVSFFKPTYEYRDANEFMHVFSTMIAGYIMLTSENGRKRLGHYLSYCTGSLAGMLLERMIVSTQNPYTISRKP